MLGQTSTVELLLNNADALHLELNSKNNAGNTGFHHACYKGQKITVELLLNNADALHLDLKSKNNNGQTGFQRAQSENKTAVVELIKAKRPSIAV
jgi:ankyrin repeat protein